MILTPCWLSEHCAGPLVLLRAHVTGNNFRELFWKGGMGGDYWERRAANSITRKVWEHKNTGQELNMIYLRTGMWTARRWKRRESFPSGEGEGKKSKLPF